MLTFDEAKRQSNLAKHGIDMGACASVFDHPMQTMEDDRSSYGEQRLCSLGWLDGTVVLMVWVERERPHIISCRKATQHETRIYFKNL
jgi:uncharacterized DUF497 family protein